MTLIINGIVQEVCLIGESETSVPCNVRVLIFSKNLLSARRRASSNHENMVEVLCRDIIQGATKER